MLNVYLTGDFLEMYCRWENGLGIHLMSMHTTNRHLCDVCVLSGIRWEKHINTIQTFCHITVFAMDMNDALNHAAWEVINLLFCNYLNAQNYLFIYTPTVYCTSQCIHQIYLKRSSWDEPPIGSAFSFLLVYLFYVNTCVIIYLLSPS